LEKTFIQRDKKKLAASTTGGQASHRKLRFLLKNLGDDMDHAGLSNALMVEFETPCCARS
jgi:hypothetical protein